MGLAAEKIDYDFPHISGSENFVNSYQTLSKEDALNRNYLYQGSGGTVTSLSCISVTGINTHVHTTVSNTLASSVEEICSAFSLTKEELATACKIQSRKTLYNWINGEAQPRKSAMNRMYDLLIIARAWCNSGFKATHPQIHQPIIDNKSIFDLLCETNIDHELILFSGTRINMLFSNQEKLADPFA